jgi:3-mercaptopyruvate sulfurtransferase SseA
MLPNAILLTGDAIKNNLALLPTDKIQRIAIYDQTGELGSTEIAQWLREKGWTMARRLKGGYAEWLEHDEPIIQPQNNENSKLQIGDPVQVKKDHGFVHKVLTRQDKTEYEIWVKGKGVIGLFSDKELL